MDMKELSNILQQNGIVGAGGAGFPTYAKLNENAETLILNCAECEPLLRLHRQLLEKYAQEIVETFHLIGQAVGAKELVIGIKKAYTKTIDALNGVIGAYPEVRLGLLDEVYPAGDEVVLIYEVTKKVVRPGGLPIEQGVAVFNVETVYNAYRAINQSTPVVDKLVSVVAEVDHPVTVRVPIGTTIEDTVKLAGGITTKNPVYFIGGPMMGFIGSGSLPVTKTTNAVLVLPEEHLIIQKKRKKTSIDLKRAAACCCQCSMCTDLCPRNRLGHPIQPHLFMRAATCKDVQEPNIFVNTMFCSSCGLCEMYSCMQGLSPRTLMAEYKAGLRANGLRPPQVEAKPVGPEREYRKVPMERLMARLDLTKYNKEAPLDESVVPVSKVKIMLSQHIGAPAAAIVKQGDKVTKGQMIAEPAKGLSVGIHASIDGVVSEVTDKYVIIETQEGRAGK
ncbi:4Fe-4S dicluster domain-containing protein [Mediterraneibacter sp. gm002]|uniref:4Fe-4S dicluster domain-containing protein n=2 Tax=Clostridia TaxID=186801 RepID=UPI000E4C02AD|nr:MULTISPECIES: 4Fe-4S dicluster domain-containing protein [Clostridia]RHV02298.1 NADH-quinone oxidoreductase subunit J [Firmicutes bacterium OM07-11]RKQ29530.1 NADH-quinone oxidoreductase subunit J [Ruminococcus sp. B05]TAP32976.1 NADH-quinone oxidoreductase subunit J [Mediterraneibacter sp. gm002]